MGTREFRFELASGRREKAEAEANVIIYTIQFVQIRVYIFVCVCVCIKLALLSWNFETWIIYKSKPSKPKQSKVSLSNTPK